MTKVFIDGSAGTTGLRIYERLGERKDIELIRLDEEHRKDNAARREAIREADIAFLCLPDAAAIEAVELAEGSDTVILDTSTAHRTAPGWAYGFPELSADHRNAVRNGRRIAVPGCYATGFISLVYPLVRAGILPKDYPLACFAISGYSGGGKKLIAQYEDPDRNKQLSSARTYAWSQEHKHLPEMKAVTGIEREPLFSPLTTDYYSGMLVQIPLYTDMLLRRVTTEDIRETLAGHYHGEKLIHVNPIGADVEKGNVIFSDEMSGRDSLQIYVTGNEDRIVVASAFDNLGKGASGAAVQNMNIVMGIDETCGLVL